MTTPQRTCIGCRATTDAGDLVRLTRSPDGGLQVGAGPGRGAWLHRDAACFDLAVKRKAVGRALRAPVAETALAELRVALGL